MYFFFFPGRENLTDVKWGSSMEIHWNPTSDVRWMSQSSGEGIRYEESSFFPDMNDIQSPVWYLFLPATALHSSFCPATVGLWSWRGALSEGLLHGKHAWVVCFCFSNIKKHNCISQLAVEFAFDLTNSWRAWEVAGDAGLTFLKERATELWEGPPWTAARNNIAALPPHSIQIN